MAAPSDEETVVEAVDELRRRDYVADFGVSRDGHVVCGSCGHEHRAEEFEAEVTFRFEGVSDPDDEAVVFGATCRSCGARGVLVAAYGPSASAEEAEVVAALSSRA